MLAACSGSAPDVQRGDCPVTPVAVVVTVAPWTDMVEALAGDCASVRTIVTGTAGDPHDYEPTPGDAAAISNADVVVANGLGYDAWAISTANAAGRGRLVDLGAATGQPADSNPHLWYDPTVQDRAADAVTAALDAAMPAAKSVFAEQRRTWTAALAPYRTALDTAQRALEGRAVAATEPVGSRLAAVLRIDDLTPAGFARAASNETEPAPSDVAEFETLLREKQVNVLVVNPQTSGPVPDALRRRADAAGVPVVELRETPPAATSWIDWQVAQLDALTKAAR